MSQLHEQVAVLLDEFLKVRDVEKSSTDVLQMSAHPLDPLLSELSAYYDEKDFVNRLRDLFDALDVDQTGSVTLSEFIIGVKQLKLNPPLQLCKEDLRDVFEDLYSPLSYERFEASMRIQMNLYVQRIARHHMQVDSHEGAFASEAADLLVLKHVVTLIENNAKNSVAQSPSGIQDISSKLDRLTLMMESVVDRQTKQEKSIQAIEERLDRLSPLEHSKSIPDPQISLAVPGQKSASVLTSHEADSTLLINVDQWL
mmetsp:Transcript_257/g.481  ORF Transcript_257/g.481 Transcript_257/m.481 type:complete len:256 (-) Transcript_257:28-795(-)